MNNQAAAKLPVVLRPWERHSVSFRFYRRRRAKTKTLDTMTKRPSRRARPQFARLVAVEIETAARRLQEQLMSDSDHTREYRRAHCRAHQEAEAIEKSLRFIELQVSFIREVYSTDVR